MKSDSIIETHELTKPASTNRWNWWAWPTKQIAPSRNSPAAIGFLMLFAQMQLGSETIGAYLPGGLVFRLAAVVAGGSMTLPLWGMGVTAFFTTLFTYLALHRLNNVEF